MPSGPLSPRVISSTGTPITPAGEGAGVKKWQCDTISSMDATIANRSLSVARDASGYPIVAFQYSDDPGPALLRVARPVENPDFPR
jgi:hypothetical protein